MAPKRTSSKSPAEDTEPIINMAKKRKDTGESSVQKKKVKVVVQSPYQRFFQTDEEEEKFVENFLERKVISPKHIDLEFFKQEGFTFPELFKQQGLEKLLTLKHPSYPTVTKAFYSALKFDSSKRLLSAHILGKQVKMTSSNIASILDFTLNKEGSLLRNIEVNLDEFKELNYKPSADKSGKMQVGKLKADSRLLHYMVVWILMPRQNNRSLVSSDDARAMWALQKNLKMDWAGIIKYFIRESENSNDLPYSHLIAMLCEKAGIDLSKEDRYDQTDHDLMNEKWMGRMKMVKSSEAVWVTKGEEEPEAGEGNAGVEPVVGGGTEEAPENLEEQNNLFADLYAEQAANEGVEAATAFLSDSEPSGSRMNSRQFQEFMVTNLLAVVKKQTELELKQAELEKNQGVTNQKMEEMIQALKSNEELILGSQLKSDALMQNQHMMMQAGILLREEENKCHTYTHTVLKTVAQDVGIMSEAFYAHKSNAKPEGPTPSTASKGKRQRQKSSAPPKPTPSKPTTVPTTVDTSSSSDDKELDELLRKKEEADKKKKEEAEKKKKIQAAGTST